MRRIQEELDLQVEENTRRTGVYRLRRIQGELGFTGRGEYRENCLQVEQNTRRTGVYRLRRIQGEHFTG